MIGFNGPFRFAVDEEGTPVKWTDLPEAIQQALEANTADTNCATVYRCAINVFSEERPRQRHHDWCKIKRVFVHALTPNASLKFLGIAPGNMLAEKSNSPEIGLGVGVRLFDLLQFRLSISNVVKLFATQSRYSVLSNHSKKEAQWVFSDGWLTPDFQLYMYLLIPDDLKAPQRHITISVKPVIRHNRTLTNVQLWKQPVIFN